LKQIDDLSGLSQLKTMHDLFAYIYSLAQNIKTELYPRYFWRHENIASPSKYVIAYGELVEKQCELTDVALSVAICGREFIEHPIDIDAMQDNEQQIQSDTEFFIYNVELDLGEMYNEGKFGKSWQTHSGHKFKVIAYRNEDHEIRYKFLQSYVQKYTLLAYLNKVNSKEIQGEYSHEEFKQFLLEFKELLKADAWNEINEFYKKYFHADCTQYHDHEFTESGTILIKYIKCDLQAVNQAQVDFNRYKCSKKFPEFIFISGEDNENQIVQNSFGANTNNAEGDKCALQSPWGQLIFQKTDAGRLLSPNYDSTKINTSFVFTLCNDRTILGLTFLFIGGTILAAGISVAAAGLIIPAFGATLTALIIASVCTGVGGGTAIAGAGLASYGFFAEHCSITSTENDTSLSLQ